MKRSDRAAKPVALLEQEIEHLRDRLREAEEQLHAIRHGEVDAVVVQADDEEVYTLERPEHPFQMLVEQIPQAAATLTAEGTILCCNERFTALVRRSAPALHGLRLEELLAPECHGTMETMLGKAAEGDAEATLILRCGDSAVPLPFCLHTIGTSAFGLCLMLTDISERKRFEELERAQAALRKSEEALRDADRKKDEFLATLAHELRNPLAPMRNAVEFLRAKGSSAPELRWAHDVMDRQVHLMARLLEDLLDVSRVALDKPGLRKDVVELAAVVNAAVETSFPLMEGAKQELEVVLPPDPVLLNADPVRLSQVFANLLNNASKYSDPGSRIRLCAELQGDEVVVSVRDSGIGIGAEQLPQVFDIFSRAKPALGRSQVGGLGIGLSLVKGLVELHGGSVEAHSDGVGAGSTFRVRLPVVRETKAKLAQPVEQAGPAARGRRRVLVIDDHRDSADSLAMLLSAMGHDVARAYDGEQGIALASELHPELILLDIGMPRLDGYEVCRRIRAEPWGRKMSVVALTGWGQEEDRRKSRAAGFDHHLVKPVEIGELTALIARLDSTDGLLATSAHDADGAASRTDSRAFPGDARTRPGWRSSGTRPAP